MKLMIVGGDKVSYYLIKQLQHTQAQITVVEFRSEVSVRLANELDVDVYNGDGTMRDVLSDAGCKEADVFIALTGKDENNLVACQLAKHEFGVKTTIAKLNNPKNKAAFEIYGVDRIYSGTAILAEMIDYELEFGGLSE